MTIFGGNKRCFVHVNAHTCSDAGASLTIGGSKVAPTSDAIVIDANINYKEKFSTINCFHNVNHIYAFGHDIGGSICTVNIVTNFGPNKSDVTGFSNILKAYNKNRLYENKKVKFTLGSLVFSGRLISVTTTSYNTEAALQNISLQILLEAPEW